MNKTGQEFNPFPYLHDVIALAHKKVTVKNTYEKNKQIWARVLIQAVTAWSTLKQDAELEQMKRDITELKELVFNKQVTA